MKQIILIFVISIFQTNDLTTQEMVNRIFYDLNYARKDPHKYLEDLNWGSDPITISKKLYKSKEPFILNDSLSRECQLWAEFIAKEQILKHSNTYTSNESISNGQYFDVVFFFISEIHSSSDGHRRHILGQDNNDTQVGIGIAKSINDVYYTVVRTIE